MDPPKRECTGGVATTELRPVYTKHRDVLDHAAGRVRTHIVYVGMPCAHVKRMERDLRKRKQCA